MNEILRFRIVFRKVSRQREKNLVGMHKSINQMNGLLSQIMIEIKHKNYEIHYLHAY